MKSGGTASPGCRRSRSREQALHASRSTRPKNAAADFVRLLLARVQLDQPLDGFRHPPRRNLRREPAERGAARLRAAADHDEVLRHGARPRRRTLPWNPIVAM